MKRVAVGTNHNMPNALIHHRPKNELQAKFSMEFCMAILLLERQGGLEQFTDEVVNRPDVQAMIQKVHFGVHPEAEAAGFDKMTTIIEIELDGGKVVRGQADFGKGSPANPMTDAELAEKFRQCAAWGGLDGKTDKGGARSRLAYRRSAGRERADEVAAPCLKASRRPRSTSPGCVSTCGTAGSGPPLLLLHGNPLTHVSWHKIAPRLAEDFTVVATDLRGYGDSSKPPGGEDHAGYSFRAMAEDQIAVMRSLGFARFKVCGHDRGGRVAHRMALDHPDAVEKVAFLDIVPTHHMLNNIKRQWAVDSYHWFFMAQPYDYPEKMIEAYGFERYIRKKLDKKGVGTAGFTPEALAEYIRCCTPENIHAVCEDYRAAVGIDLVHDEADLATKLAMPMLVLWGEKSHVNRSYKPIEAWRERALDVRGKMLACGHYPAEQVPDETYAELRSFFS